MRTRAIKDLKWCCYVIHIQVVDSFINSLFQYQPNTNESLHSEFREGIVQFFTSLILNIGALFMQISKKQQTGAILHFIDLDKKM